MHISAFVCLQDPRGLGPPPSRLLEKRDIIANKGRARNWPCVRNHGGWSSRGARALRDGWGTWPALPAELLQDEDLLLSGKPPAPTVDAASVRRTADSGGRGGGHGLLLWGLWATRRTLVLGPEGLARLQVQREKPGHQSPACQ